MFVSLQVYSRLRTAAKSQDWVIISAYGKTKLTGVFFFWVILWRMNFMRWRFGTLCSLFIGCVRATYEEGIEGMFRNVGNKILTPSSHPKDTAFRKRRKFEIGKLIEVVNVIVLVTDVRISQFKYVYRIVAVYAVCRYGCLLAQTSGKPINAA